MVQALNIQGSIGISFPPPAKINWPEDSANPVGTTDCQCGSVVFAVVYVREFDLSENRGIKSPWSSQTIDAQGIVTAVFRCPFAMVDDPWRNLFELEVNHTVATDHHRTILLVKSIDYDLKDLFVTV